MFPVLHHVHCSHSEGDHSVVWWEAVHQIIYELLCDFQVRVMTLDLVIQCTHNLPRHCKDKETEKE